VSLHGYQVLAGMILAAPDAPTVGSQAMRALAAGRQAGRTDPDILADQPVVLALTGPRLGAGETLPPVPAAVAASSSTGDLALLAPREALRLRARWVQELMARAVWCLAGRLAIAGRLDRVGDVRLLGFAELLRLTSGGPPPADLASRRERSFGPPLPAAFRLTARGTVVPYRAPGATARGGLPVGGGRGVGRACAHRGDGRDGEPEVLVVRTLDPRLAASLPGLAGLVAETGGALSHLAILAREQRVPIVVGVQDAVRRFPPGTRLLVDGMMGDVVEMAESEAQR